MGVLLARDDRHVNLQRIRRVHTGTCIWLPKTKSRKQVSTARAARPVHSGPNSQWSNDVITDAFADGRRVRVLSVVDACTRECLAL